MNDMHLLSWLREQQPVLDQIIADAAQEFYEHHKSRPNFGFDLAACQSESYNLANNLDLCYDRPNTAFSYSLWYHARRVNTFLTHFATIFLQHDRPTLECFDLGAGTGAVQWAIGLLYQYKKLNKLSVPKVKIINIDTSPFMLTYGRDYLWRKFLDKYSHCLDFSDDIEYEVNAWTNKRSIVVGDPWITASYLFDISDTADIGDYRQAVVDGFAEILNTYDPSRLLLLTSLYKEPLLREVTDRFNINEYVVERVQASRLILSGDLPVVSGFRAKLLEEFNSDLTTIAERSIGRSASWSDTSFVATVVSKRSIELFRQSSIGQKVRLHDTSIKIRREVVLNAEQMRAAQNNDQPTVVIGPAGCGKSIVITERIKNIVEELD